MGFITSLFAREDRFARLLETAAAEVVATVNALSQLLANRNPAITLTSFVQARAKEQEIKDRIDALLCQRAPSRLDHGDIVNLALGLNRINKAIRRFAERHMLCQPHTPSGMFAAQSTLLGEAGLTLHQMIIDLGNGASLSTIKHQNDRLQRIKGEADQLFTTGVIHLYQGRHDPFTSIMLRDLFEVLDRIFDRIRNTSNLILQIGLKQS